MMVQPYRTMQTGREAKMTNSPSFQTLCPERGAKMVVSGGRGSCGGQVVMGEGRMAGGNGGVGMVRGCP